MSSEAKIHFELYRHLKNAIGNGIEHYGIRFIDVEPEANVDGGFADIVVYIEGKKPFLVIEAKRKNPSGGYNRDIDPYSPIVIQQAFDYAGKLGASYFATYNGTTLVLFRTFEKGTHLLDRKTNAYAISKIEQFSVSFLKEVAGLEKDELKWDPRHQAFVKRLFEFHSRLKTNMKKPFLGKLQSDKKFKKEFEQWTKTQGWDPSNQEKILERFITQAAYLMMNKLVFYKILEDEEAYPNVPQVDFSTSNFTEELKETFEELIEKVDFEAIYEQDPIYDEVPIESNLAVEIQEFLEELELYNLSQFDYDVIGTIYENIIPSKERHDLGQYYTPPEIVELIVKTTIKDPNDLVLDPACGSGGFLVRAYERLKELKKKRGITPTHKDILNQLHGIDINRFPAHLTAINLALRDLNSETKQINLEVQDFFRLFPDQNRLGVEKATTSGVKEVIDLEEIKIPPKINVIIANPPYIRQEKIANKKLCRSHLERIGYKGIRDRSDIYVYFFTHSYEFLAEDGRLGFITSNKWLTTGYGEDLQKFFLDKFKIKAIIEFSKSVFDDPLVPTCITLLEKSEKEEEKAENLVKFLRIKKQIDFDRIIEYIENNYTQEGLIENKDLWMFCVKQKNLRNEKKWNKYLHAPGLYWELISHQNMIKLKEIALIEFKIKSGCNDFFYLKSNIVKKWGIDKCFVRPLAKSIRQIDAITFKEKDTDILVLDLNDYIESKFVGSKLATIGIKQMKGIKLPLTPSNTKIEEITHEETYILKELFEDGFQGLYKYVIHSMWEKNWGKDDPPHLRPTCISRRSQNHCWFNLGELTVPDLLIPETCWDRIFVPINTARFVADRNLYDLYLHDKSKTKVIAGLLNSNIFRLFREIDGRVTGAGASRVVIYEIKNMRIPDPTYFSKQEANQIEECVDNLLKTEVNSNEFETKQKDLDKVILSILDMDDKIDELYETVKALSLARREGKEREMLLDGLEFKKPIKFKPINGAERAKKKNKQTKLVDY